MKKTIKKVAAGLLFVPALALGVSLFTPEVGVSALGMTEGINAAQGTDVATDLTTGDNSVFKTIVNVLLFVIGAVSVIMLIIGGIRYTVSNGDSSAVTGAKNTILYAIVGLAIAFFAYAVVNWVMVNLGTAA